MVPLHTIASEVELKSRIALHFKQYRIFQQNILYFDRGADLYYEVIRARKLSGQNYGTNDAENYVSELVTYLDRHKETIVIGLGCGNSEMENNIMQSLLSAQYPCRYVGVDTSMRMLELSQLQLESISYPAMLICADFASESFRDEFKSYTNRYDHRLYCLLGTFGNVEQGYFGDILSNLLEPGDKLWIDVNTLQDDSAAEKQILHDRYQKRLADPLVAARLGYPLDEYGIDREKGRLFLEMSQEHGLKSLCFRYGFQVFEPIHFYIQKDMLTLVPDDVLEIETIRVYDVERLISFFELRHFKLLSFAQIGQSGQFLFEKTVG